MLEIPPQPGEVLPKGGGQSGRVNPGPPSTSRPLATFIPVPAPENHAQHRKILHRAGATRVGENSERRSLN